MPKIDSYFRSDIGKKRDNNEDYSKSYEPPTFRELNQSGRLYVVADGMGGHQQGEKASSFAVETLLKFYYEAPEIPPEKRLNDIIKQINLKLVEYSEKNLPRGEKTGTTLVVAVIRQGKFLVANVGDSRAYLIRDGKIKQITRDHSFVAEMVRAGTLSEAEARESKYRSRLSRSVGGAADLEVDIHPPTRLRRGDIILLCTDGLTGHVSEKDILQSVHGSAKDIAERLISLANERGGADNITASVIKYGETFSLPFGLTIRKLALVGTGILTLGAFAFLGWFTASNWTSIFPLPNQTSSPTLAASPSAAASFTLSFSPTVEPTLTLAPPATETPSPPINESPALPSTEPPLPGVVVCEYVVAPGENVSLIAEKFGVGGEQVFREDGTQTDMGIIRVGEKLIINGITQDVCVNGGGTPRP